ncbi:MAG TPA: DNA polymerase IV [Caulobacteraceae bacterium]|nr:DNA polymerase IV [Caulobacteraceae bacterium]
MTSLCRDCLWQAEAPARRCPACRSPRVLSHPELAALRIAHLDCDAFYASVEKRDRPELRDRPVIVGGGRRGVVTTACYIARLSGVRSAMPMFKAARLCPEAVIIKPDFAKYRRDSRAIMARLAALSPLVQPLSLDEAWIDLTGTARLHGAIAAATLARLQAEIERDIGISVSIGLAPNKFLAKIASDLDKPRGFAVIGAAEARSFLAPRPAAILPGVGPVLARSLAAAGFRTVGDLAGADPKQLAGRHGAFGARLASLSRGEDDRPVESGQARKSLSAETTFDTDLSDPVGLAARLWPLCETVARRLRTEVIAGRAVTLKLRASDFRIVTRRRTLPAATQTARTLFSAAREMLAATALGEPWRLIGVGVADFTAAGDLGADLFEDREARVLGGEKAVDSLRARYGDGVVVRGVLLGR